MLSNYYAERWCNKQVLLMLYKINLKCKRLGTDFQIFGSRASFMRRDLRPYTQVGNAPASSCTISSFQKFVWLCSRPQTPNQLVAFVSERLGKKKQGVVVPLRKKRRILNYQKQSVMEAPLQKQKLTNKKKAR